MQVLQTCSGPRRILVCRAEFQLHPGIDDKFPSTSSRTTVDSPRPTVVAVTKHNPVLEVEVAIHL